MGLKETEELIVGLTEIVKLAKKVRDIVSDGTSVEDLPKVFELVKDQISKSELYSLAVKDSALIKDELKDLSKEEILELFMKLTKSISEIEKA